MMDEKEYAREALAVILAAFPQEEIDNLRTKLTLRGRLGPMAEDLFVWVEELHAKPEHEVTDEHVRGMVFLAKRVNQELEKIIKEQDSDRKREESLR